MLCSSIDHVIYHFVILWQMWTDVDKLEFFCVLSWLFLSYWHLYAGCTQNGMGAPQAHPSQQAAECQMGRRASGRAALEAHEGPYTREEGTVLTQLQPVV